MVRIEYINNRGTASFMNTVKAVCLADDPYRTHYFVLENEDVVYLSNTGTLEKEKRLGGFRKIGHLAHSSEYVSMRYAS